MKHILLTLLIAAFSMVVHSQERKRCTGINSHGQQCGNVGIVQHKDSVYRCNYHNPNRPQCKGKTKEGRECKLPPKEGKEKCWRHDVQ